MNKIWEQTWINYNVNKVIEKILLRKNKRIEVLFESFDK